MNTERKSDKVQKSDKDRILEAEMSLTHLQHDFDALNTVVLEQQKTIEELSVLIQRLETKVDANTDPEIRDAEAERPPHY
jgi:uncharacterized coiled-coil protein SlyX